MSKRLGIAWQVGVPSGWGTYGVNLAVQLARKGFTPTLFFLDQQTTLTQEQAEILAGPLAERDKWAAAAREPAEYPFPILHALGDQLEFTAKAARLKGQPDIGVTFFESAVVPPANLEKAD